MKSGLRAFRHLESTYCQKPKQFNQMQQIGFKKDQPAKKQAGR
ncbi:hypothetical protein [Limosilactobacillus sp.]|jgi:hypothetical protein|nr:hypothetical protein [Limosilactobacillus sp.]